MGRIKILPPSVFNLISAGEVVEKPFGAVKELVENSIDAGASRIVIEVNNGGFDLVAVTDNGCGMYEDDVEAAFVKHATSKLESAANLAAIDTLGFRGEALSSIAAVSRIRLVTRTKTADTAVEISVEDGVVSDKRYVSANPGTRIEVRDLFYNTPARKKFLKDPAHEAAEITKFVSKLILSNPTLEICYILNGEEIFSTKGNGLEEAIYQIYGPRCLDKCIKIHHVHDDMLVEGYIANPEYTKPNRNAQTLSVNGRCISDQGITGAIQQAYRPFLMTRTFPVFVLNLVIPCDNVDVNVHPKKTEVRFANPAKVCAAFYHSVTDALNNYTFLQSQQTFARQDEQPTDPELQMKQEDFLNKFEQFVSDDDVELMTRHQSEAMHDMEKSTEQADNKKSILELGDLLQTQLTVAQGRRNLGLDRGESVMQPSVFAEAPAQSAPSEEDLLYFRTRILGAIFKTYLILEIDDKVIFVDQHAAHERILFDKFMAQKTNDMQPVLVPYTFTVTDDEALFIQENRENILSAGIEVEDFGKNTFRITAVSTLLCDLQMKEFVQFMLSSIDEFKVDDRTLIVETLAKKACKAAVKAGYVLNEYEVKYILKQVCDNKILQCPHGRPITVVFTKTQLEKMFKRIV